MANDPIAKVIDFVRRIAQPGFFGKLVIGFQNGKPVDIRIETVKKVDEL